MKKQPTRDRLLDVTFDEVYIHGYTATSVDTILRKAAVPKGSMYHHFKSKRELIRAMVQERLFPKMDDFFHFERGKGQSVTDAIGNTFAAMGRNKPLITHGCPLYRLMVELSPVDTEFDTLLSGKVSQMQMGLASLLQEGKERGEFHAELNTETMAAYILNSTWGVLSLSPTLSSPKNFVNHIRHILSSLALYRVDQSV